MAKRLLISKFTHARLAANSRAAGFNFTPAADTEYYPDGSVSFSVDDATYAALMRHGATAEQAVMNLLKYCEDKER